VALAFAPYSAIEGGEYGTFDLLALRRQVAGEQAQVLNLATHATGARCPVL
jgi:hypothetical protein